MACLGEGDKTSSFNEMLHARVEEWLTSEESRTVPCAELYRYLPALYQLLARLALDHRVDERDRAALRATLKYIVAPFDLIPEGVVGTSGFRDDLVLAAFVVDRLTDRLAAAVVRGHWQHAGDPFAIARGILEAATSMVGGELCARLKEWVPS
ncbi:MAG: YkvA family protein [Acidobacteriota bacterium]